MLRNYFTIALRNVRKQKLYAAINVFGLAIGLAFCALIFLYIQDKLSFDRFHEKADRIFRVHRVPAAPDLIYEASVSLPLPLAPALKETFPEIEHGIRLDGIGNGIVRREGQLFEQNGIVFTDPAFFEVFTFPLKEGDPATALDDPFSVVLTASMARKYFGETSALGQRLSVQFQGTFHDLRVTGVARDIPLSSSIRFNLLIPYEGLYRISPYVRDRADSWGHSRTLTYVMLHDYAQADQLAARLPGFTQTFLGETFESMREHGFWDGDGPPISYALQPLADIHLNPAIPAGITPPSDPLYSYILAAIALMVLLIACINFMTLAIGRSARRAREIGVRKVFGAQRWQVMAQFWGEALFLSFLGLVVGSALAELFLPVFNDLTGKTFRFDYTQNGVAVAVFIAVMLLTGLISGSYPAVVLSRFKPIESFKNTLKLGRSNVFTRSLVTAQFALSIFLVACTLIMASQLRYMKTKNLGFSGEQVVVLPATNLDGEAVLTYFRNTLAAHPQVVSTTGANLSFSRASSRRGFRHEGEPLEVFNLRIEHNYLETLHIDLVDGRNFDPNLATDSTQAVLINEAMARRMGWTDPIGQRLPDLAWGPLEAPTVIGVVQDFNISSLRNTIEPVVLSLNPVEPIRFVLIRLRAEDLPTTLALLENYWTEIAPEVPFQFSFLDEDMDRLYLAEDRWSRIVGYGSFFAIIIACLGLFGLASLTTAGRTKEIGVRKVLGASSTSIALLLSKDFTRFVLVALVLATPTAYLVMNRWLEGFAYRVDVSWTIFLVTGLVALIISGLTVSYQAIKAALADPVRALRYE